MKLNHQKFIKDKFNIKIPLFNEITYGKTECILDFEEYVPNIKIVENSEKEFQKYTYYIVDYIYNSMSNFAHNLIKWI